VKNECSYCGVVYENTAFVSFCSKSCYKSDYYRKNKVRIEENHRRYRLLNREKINKYHRAYRATKGELVGNKSNKQYIETLIKDKIWYKMHTGLLTVPNWVCKKLIPTLSDTIETLYTKKYIIY